MEAMIAIVVFFISLKIFEFLIIKILRKAKGKYPEIFTKHKEYFVVLSFLAFAVSLFCSYSLAGVTCQWLIQRSYPF